jgi:hypothetical protein
VEIRSNARIEDRRFFGSFIAVSREEFRKHVKIIIRA